MNDKTDLNYIPYMRLINYKNQVKMKFKYFLELGEDTLEVSSDELALFSTIDYNNLNKEIIDFNNIILNGIKDYLKDENKTYELKRENIKELLSLEEKGKINPELNEKIALKYAKDFNSTNNNKTFDIDYELIKKICRNIK